MGNADYGTRNVGEEQPSDTCSDYLLNTVTKTIPTPGKIGLDNASCAEISAFNSNLLLIRSSPNRSLDSA